MKTISLFVITMICIHNLVSWNWPDEPNRIISSFGLPWANNFERGIRFINEGQRVSTWHDGEIIWLKKSGSNLLVLEHENGFRSIYSGVECRPDLGKTVRQGDWIGYVAEESWQFQIEDVRTSRIVNPANLLPHRAYSGDRKDVDVRLSMGMKYLKLEDGMPIPTGNWNLTLSGLDPKTIPMTLDVWWGGKIIYSLQFQSIVLKENSLALETHEFPAYSEIYDNYNRIIIQNIVQDFETEKSSLIIELTGARDTSWTWKW